MSEIFAVLDTETSYDDDLISLGIVLADAESLQPVRGAYWIFEESVKPAIFSSSLRIRKFKGQENISRKKGMAQARAFLKKHEVSRIFAYNAGFDFGHLPELQDFEWFDIMKVAAYKTHNPYIPDHLPSFSTGRLKSGYGVEKMVRMLSGNSDYYETHNAFYDALDELYIMQKLEKHPDFYAHTRIRKKYGN
jgi:hypothetical protein